MQTAAMLAEIEAARDETFAAADRILESIEAALALLPDVRRADGGAIDALQKLLCGMLEAMSFQDITGQRLSRVVSLLGENRDTRRCETLPSELSLENGPALPGDGVSQADADSFFEDRDPESFAAGNNVRVES